MRISSRVFGALAIVLFGCGTRTLVVPIGPPETTHEPVPADSVFEFVHPNRILTKHRPLARVSAGLGYMDGTEEDSPRLSLALRDRAGELGAQGIVFGGDCKASREVRKSDGLPSGCVTAVRLLDLESLPEGTVRRSPGEIRARLGGPRPQSGTVT